MEIILAKSAGFCFGVKKAIDTVLEESKTEKLCTYGPLIHNKIFISDLERKGVRVVENISEARDEKIVLRSHGVPPKIYSELLEKNLEYIDCTCPFVKNIHDIVNKNYTLGSTILIIGDKIHPEIIGIHGYSSNEGIILENITDVKNYTFDNNKKYCLVVQTTFDIELFDEILDYITKLNLNITIHNTICSATKERQNEASELSKNVDKMIVIGDKKSSNTKKLYDISKKNCKNSYLIESIQDLELNIFSYGDKIGITAGASTAPCIIKEAINTMSDELSFEEMLDQSFVTIHSGEIIKGKVIRVSNGEISVNLGYKSDGLITRNELSDDPNFKAEDEFKVDDDIEVFVVKVNDGDGNVVLSRKRLLARKGMEEIEKAFNEKSVVKGKVVEAVKGGLMALINGMKIFVPSSQISNKYVEDLKEFMGKEFNFNIIEFDPSKRRIVAGRKELAQKEEATAKAKVFETLEVNKRVKGTVRRIVDFGAFVDLGGVDGLIHISELSWGRVKKVKDVLKEGDVVDVVVIEFDKEKGKISLSLKDIENDPWKDVTEKYPVGSVVSGKVVRMAPFGVFVELEDGIDGLVHISQISEKHVAKPEDVLKIGDIIDVKVTEVNSDNKRISLSKKEVDSPTVETVVEEVSVTEEPNSEEVTE